MIDPRGLTFQEWADYMVPSIEAYGVVGRADDSADWRPWCQGVANLSEMQNRGVPAPYQFGTWQDWAFAFVQQFDRGL